MDATVLSCFSGVGGLDLGLEAAGFKTVGCLETNAAARQALAANRPDWELLDPSDVIEAGGTLGPSDLGLAVGELTLIAGGPPCQPFSKAAQWVAPKRGITDTRGTAVDGMLALVQSFLPRAVLMENVAGFLSGEFNARGRIEEAFGAINDAHGTHYRLMSWVVDAADYGVPQRRRRAIVLAFRDGAEFAGPLPATHENDWRTAWDALGDAVPEGMPPLVGKYADLLASIPEGANYQYLTAKGAGPEKELFGYRTRFWSFLLKLAKDRPAWTLPASPGPSTGPFHWDNRPLTSSERMLLQGFPAGWKLLASERVSTRLAGNATPPPLAEAMGSLILEALSPSPDFLRLSAPTLATRRRAEPPPPPQPARPLPARWQVKVSAQSAHPGPGDGPRGYFTRPEAATAFGPGLQGDD